MNLSTNMLRAVRRPFVARMYSTSGEKASVLIFGGNTTLGRSVTAKLAPHASRITIGCLSTADEYNSKNRHQNVSAAFVDISDQRQVEPLVAEHDVVINMVGPSIELEYPFVKTHVEGSRNIAHSARKNNTKQLIHVSALGSAPDHPCDWLDWKYRGEDMAYASFPDATIVKPSLMYSGEKDSTTFVDSIINAHKFLPFIVLPYYKSLVAPVKVEDVADAIVKVSNVGSESFDAKGKTLLLEGAESESFGNALKRLSGKPVLYLPQSYAQFILAINQFLPGARLTRDHIGAFEAGDITVEQVMSDIFDPRIKENLLTFKDIGINPRKL
ncbi:NADH dehydrogenase (ubiquinone) 1 alpha subcomplex subunit 9 [Acrasis kona]|uniref:NADH dehydrogenase (Ubiquinone) 1 alpha subcomplex subunit 9 n=1 Tax=Acrasis kona TaxID=1008807 RepID=A0AAW2YKC1_9EUKA